MFSSTGKGQSLGHVRVQGSAHKVSMICVYSEGSRCPMVGSPFTQARCRRLLRLRTSAGQTEATHVELLLRLLLTVGVV